MRWPGLVARTVMVVPDHLFYATQSMHVSCRGGLLDVIKFYVLLWYFSAAFFGEMPKRQVRCTFRAHHTASHMCTGVCYALRLYSWCANDECTRGKYTSCWLCAKTCQPANHGPIPRCLLEQPLLTASPETFSNALGYCTVTCCHS